MAVAGTHGKTTTSAMLSVIMRVSFSIHLNRSVWGERIDQPCHLIGTQENKFDINALIGGRVRQFPGKYNPPTV